MVKRWTINVRHVPGTVTDLIFHCQPHLFPKSRNVGPWIFHDWKYFPRSFKCAYGIGLLFQNYRIRNTTFWCVLIKITRRNVEGLGSRGIFANAISIPALHPRYTKWIEISDWFRVIAPGVAYIAPFPPGTCWSGASCPASWALPNSTEWHIAFMSNGNTSRTEAIYNDCIVVRSGASNNGTAEEHATLNIVLRYH